MEIESKNGWKIRLEEGGCEQIDFGRGLGFDRTVSRHHISLKLDEDGSRVSFQVKGKNPIWVRHSTTHGIGIVDITLYKTSERGQFKTGDSFCVSSKNPLWFTFNRQEDEQEEDDGHDDIDTRDLSDIHPAKEFNFVLMGHEFDCYPKKLMRDIKNWNWFLEEPDEDSDQEDDNGEKKLKKVVRKKRKKGGRGDDDDDDDVWTGESEEDVELIKKSRTDPKPKYSTRLKDKNKKGECASKSAKDDAKRNLAGDDDDDDEEEDDETLGGFIVDDEDIREGNEDDDEEEEFEEDEDDE